MSDRIVKPCFRVYRVLRKPHGKILWSCRTQTLGLLGEVNRVAVALQQLVSAVACAEWAWRPCTTCCSSAGVKGLATRG